MSCYLLLRVVGFRIEQQHGRTGFFVLPNVKWKEKWIQFNHMENEWLGFPLCMLEKYTFLYHPRYEKRNDGIKWEAQWSFFKKIKKCITFTRPQQFKESGTKINKLIRGVDRNTIHSVLISQRVIWYDNQSNKRSIAKIERCSIRWDEQNGIDRVGIHWLFVFGMLMLWNISKHMRRAGKQTSHASLAIIVNTDRAVFHPNDSTNEKKWPIWDMRRGSSAGTYLPIILTKPEDKKKTLLLFVGIFVFLLAIHCARFSTRWIIYLMKCIFFV